MNTSYLLRTLIFSLLMLARPTVSMSKSVSRLPCPLQHIAQKLQIKNRDVHLEQEQDTLPTKTPLSNKETQQTKPPLLQSYTLEQREALKHTFMTNLMNKPWGKVAEQEIKKLEAEEQAIFQECSQITGVDPKIIQHRIRGYCSKSMEFHEADSEKAHDSTINIADNKYMHTVLHKAGIAADLIACKHRKDPHAPSSENHTIFIDPSAKLYKDAEVYKIDDFKASLFAHELAHIICFDSIAIAAFLTYANELRAQNTVNCNDLVYKYMRFQEKRADIFGCLLSSDYADAASTFYENCYCYKKPFYEPTHPTYGTRASYLHDLCSDMESTEGSHTQNAP